MNFCASEVWYENVNYHALNQMRFQSPRSSCWMRRSRTRSRTEIWSLLIFMTVTSRHTSKRIRSSRVIIVVSFPHDVWAATNKCMLVKKGQNSKVIIYMTRQWYIHQDLCIYIKIHITNCRQYYIYIYIKICIYTSRFVYIHQDLHIYIKTRVNTSRFIYTSRFAYIHQDSCIYIKIHIYTSRFVMNTHRAISWSMVTAGQTIAQMFSFPDLNPVSTWPMLCQILSSFLKKKLIADWKYLVLCQPKLHRDTLI